MFTGIIETCARVVSLKKTGRNHRLALKTLRPLGGLKKGQSIAVSGVCLTLTVFEGNSLGFDIVPQTLRVTALGTLESGDRVNLERALKYGDRLDGHCVLGHVEARGRLVRVTDDRRGMGLTIRFPAKLAPRIVPKGCIAVDGVSLTVARVQSGAFTVFVIPHTLKLTNLKTKLAGCFVNLETDILGRSTRIQNRWQTPC